jgi:carbonic anhydrase
LGMGCSDSPVPANEIVGLDPGALFVQRNPANLAAPKDAYYLSVSMVVGHYGSGGVTAAVDGRRRGLVDHGLDPIREVLAEHRPELEAS